MFLFYGILIELFGKYFFEKEGQRNFLKNPKKSIYKFLCSFL